LIHDDMHWIGMISDTGYAYDDPIEIIVDIEFRVGFLTGCFPIGYIATKATPNLICSGVQSWAPISYPHPIQIETTDDCNSITAVAEEDWQEIKENLSYSYMKDGHYAEMRDMDVLRERLDILNSMEPYIGDWFSKEYVQKHVFRMSQEEINKMDRQINKEPEPDDHEPTANPMDPDGPAAPAVGPGG